MFVQRKKRKKERQMVTIDGNAWMLAYRSRMYAPIDIAAFSILFFLSMRHMVTTSVIFEYHLTNVKYLKNVESSRSVKFREILRRCSFFFFFLSSFFSFSSSTWQRFDRSRYRFSKNQVVRKDKAYLKRTAVFGFWSLRREKSNRCKIVLADAIATEKHSCQSACMSFLHGTCHALLPPSANKPDTVLSLS